MKRLNVICIILFSLLIISGAEYQCYKRESSFNIIERTLNEEYEFIQNGVKFEYTTDNPIYYEKGRVINILENNLKADIKEVENNIITSYNSLSYDINFINGNKTKVEIIIINNIEEYTCESLRQALDIFIDNKCKDKRYYYFIKSKVIDENILIHSSILNQLNEDTIEEVEISNGKAVKAETVDGNSVNIGQINYNTGMYLIIGTPVIFVTY